MALCVLQTVQVVDFRETPRRISSLCRVNLCFTIGSLLKRLNSN